MVKGTVTLYKATPKAPCARNLHSCVVYKNNLVIFGGIDEKGNLFNDVHIFNIGIFFLLIIFFIFFFCK